MEVSRSSNCSFARDPSVPSLPCISAKIMTSPSGAGGHCRIMTLLMAGRTR